MGNPEKHMMLIKGLLILNNKIYKASVKIGNIRNNKLLYNNTKKQFTNDSTKLCDNQSKRNNIY